MTTDFSKQVEILGAFYLDYREQDSLEEFFEFNDIGLPLAWLGREGLCEINEDGKKYIAESWELLLSTLKIEDTGFNNLDEILAASRKSPDSWE